MSTSESVVRKLGRSVMIFSIVFVVATGCRIWIRNIARRPSKRESDSHSLHLNLMYSQLGDIAFYFILAVGLIFILPTYGVDTMAILGTVGLAIGLASQNVLNNMMSGIFILVNDTYRIDDVVKVQLIPYYDATGSVIIGTVKGFNLFYTRLATPTGKEVAIPNSILYGNTSVVENQSISYS